MLEPLREYLKIIAQPLPSEGRGRTFELCRVRQSLGMQTLGGQFHPLGALFGHSCLSEQSQQAVVTFITGKSQHEVRHDHTDP